MTGICVLHLTDASASGVLTSVTTLTRRQAGDDRFARVVFAYVPRDTSPPADQIADLAGPGVEVLRWSERTSSRRLVDLAVQLRTILREEHFDVVHLHSSRAGFLGRWVAALAGRGGTTVYSPHAYAFAYAGLSPARRFGLWVLELIGMPAGRRLALVSESEERVARRAFPWARTAVLPNTIDVDRLQHATWTPDADRPTVGHVGRIAPAKAPELFAAVADHVTRTRPGVRFRWLGDGDRALFGARAAAVEVSGWLDPDALQHELSSLSALLFTSRGEGMSMAVLEAQAVGVPVVASSVTGVVDLIDDGTTGFLAHDAAGLTGALDRLLDDHELAAGISARAAVSARGFDVAGSADRSVTCYAALLPTVGRARGVSR